MKIGTIGTGSIVSNILKSIESVEGICCGAVYSRREESGRKLADSFGISKVYTNLDHLLEDNEIDIIYIASPNSLHFEQAKAALKKGKHVIVEKPFTGTLEEAKELVQIAEQNRLFLFEAITVPYLPNYRSIKAMLPEIGRIRIALCNYSQYSRRYDKFLAGSTPNVFNPVYAGGALEDINLYNIHFMAGLFGKPCSVKYYPNIHENGIDTSGIFMMQYEDFQCSCEGAKDTWGLNFVQLQGEKGYIYVKDGSNGCKEVMFTGKQESRSVNKQAVSWPWFYEMQEITKIIQNQDYEECAKYLEVTLNVVEIMEKGRKEAGILFPADKQDSPLDFAGCAIYNESKEAMEEAK